MNNHHHAHVDVDGVKTVSSLVPSALRTLTTAAEEGMEERRQSRLRKLAAVHRRQREFEREETIRKEGARK